MPGIRDNITGIGRREKRAVTRDEVTVQIEAAVAAIPALAPTAPSATTTIANVSGLQAALNAKQNAVAVPAAFTPTVVGMGVAGVGTYTVQSGWAMQVGKLVVFHIHLVVIGHTGSGAMRVAGLPVAAANTVPMPVAVHGADNLALTASHVLSAAVVPDSSQIELGQSPVGGGVFATVPVDTAFTLSLGGHYFAA